MLDSPYIPLINTTYKKIDTWIHRACSFPLVTLVTRSELIYCIDRASASANNQAIASES